MTSKKREQIKNLILQLEVKQNNKKSEKPEIKSENGEKKVRSLSQTSISNDSADSNSILNQENTVESSSKKMKTDKHVNNNDNKINTNPNSKGTNDIIRDINTL